MGHGVDFVGEIDELQKPEFYAGARATLFPSDWPEPFGLVMIESLAAGTPVIALRRGSVPEVIVDGVTGFICDDVDEMAQAAERIGEIDPEECRRHAETVLRRGDVPRLHRGLRTTARSVAPTGRWRGTPSGPDVVQRHVERCEAWLGPAERQAEVTAATGGPAPGRARCCRSWCRSRRPCERSEHRGGPPVGSGAGVVRAGHPPGPGGLRPCTPGRARSAGLGDRGPGREPRSARPEASSTPAETVPPQHGQRESRQTNRRAEGAAA